MADELLARLSFQCRSRFFVMPYGTAKLVVRQLGQASAHSIAKNEIKRHSMSVQRSKIGDLVNYFNAYYDLDHSKETRSAAACKSNKNYTDATSVGLYGQKEPKGYDFIFDAVTDSSMLDHVCAFWLSFLKDIRSVPEFVVFLDNSEIEPGDIIDLTHDLDSMSAYVCEVLKIQHIMGNKSQIDCVKVTAIEN